VALVEGDFAAETSNAERAAGMLIQARLNRLQLPYLPPDVAPTSVNESYAIQDLIVGYDGGAGGWKIAPRPNGGEFLCSPIPAAFFSHDFEAVDRTHLVQPEAEAELAVRIGADLPDRATPYTTDDVLAAIAEVIPIVEILNSRFEDRRTVAPLSAIADLQNCGAVVVGQGGAPWRDVDMAATAMAMRIDSKDAGAIAGGAASHHVGAAIVWLANHAAERGHHLKRGDIVITGARIGPLRVRHGARIEADTKNVGTVKFTV
jgi:2-keto-4-pentenoate hydratase